jgi:hypothetical protein
MTTYYNRIAGQSVERLAAISDGLFAVAMTLLLIILVQLNYVIAPRRGILSRI